MVLFTAAMRQSEGDGDSKAYTDEFMPNTASVLQEFVPVARELEKNWTRFTPHYIVWVCPRVYRQSEECQSQCIHQGRYCTPDPDGDLQDGYSGRDVVQVCAAHSSQ